jgi:hypothetical protein
VKNRWKVGIDGEWRNYGRYGRYGRTKGRGEGGLLFNFSLSLSQLLYFQDLKELF